MSKIAKIWAREILDSRGIPTVEAICQLDNGYVSVASVPAGTSTGSHEALELRDKDNPRYKGLGVLTAVANVNNILGPALVGFDPAEQEAIDAKLIQLDGTENKSKYGANSILSVSIVVLKAASMAQGKNLYVYVNTLAQKIGLKPYLKIPTPIFNMINGGLHGSGNLDFQEFHVIPVSSKTYSQSLQMCSEIYLTIGENLARRGAVHSVGDEAGYAPNLFTNADALEVFVESIKEARYNMGRDVFLGLDVASSYFYKNGEFIIRDKSAPMNDDSLLEYYKTINAEYHLAILEDGFPEDSWDSWKKLMDTFQGQITIVGDDLLVTNPVRVQKAIDMKACNAILVKPNQIGTVSETLKVIKMAKDAGWKVVISHRSGETNDTFIADFSVGVGGDYVKFGAPARGERVAKYNRLSAIEIELFGIQQK